MPITKAPKVRIYNASGETIPSRSFVQVDADRARGDHRVYDVVKPDGNGLVYLVTENRPIASTDYGIAYNPTSPVPVKHSSAPSPVVEVGPSSGSWEMSTTGEGFAAMRVSGSYTYVQRTGSSGGSQIIRFQITAVDCGTCSAIADVKSRPPGVSRVRGENDYGQVTIYDFRRCVFTGPDLVDRQGMAALMTTNDFEAVCADPPDFEVGDTVTVWEVLDLCCADYGCGGNE